METLHAKVEEQRARLRHAIEQVPTRRSRLEALRLRAEGMLTSRATLRDGKALLRQCYVEEKEIERVAQGRELDRFEARIQPFIHAQTHLNTVKRSDHEKATGAMRLPGGRKRRRVGSNVMWTEQKVSADGTVVRAFMCEFEGMATRDTIGDDTCAICGGRMLMLERKSTVCCEDCGHSTPHIDLTTCTQTQKGDIEFVSQTYKRSNHFLEWLNQCQAKESTRVSDTVLESVMRELYKIGIRECESVNVQNVRAALKTLKMRSQYEHVCQITCRINGEPPPRLQPAIEERLRLMFLAMQGPFELVKGRRKNFLSYAYTLQQMLSLLGVDIASIRNLGFTLLKGRDKLEKQNLIYEKVCHHLGWHYKPVVYTQA